MIKKREQLISQAISSNSALQEQQRQASSLDNVKKKMKKVGLLGTKFTMEGEFFKKKFIENNIDIIIPKED